MPRKTVIITGAASELGKAVALTFAKRDYNIILADKCSKDDLVSFSDTIRSTTQGICYVFAGDLGNPDIVRRFFGEVAVCIGGADILVNCFGAYDVEQTLDSDLIQKISDEGWYETIGTHLASCFFCCRNTVRYMIKQQSGCIINVTSASGVSGIAEQTAFSAACSGIIGLTKSLAKELSDKVIPVKALIVDQGDPESTAELIEHISDLEPNITGQIFTS